MTIPIIGVIAMILLKATATSTAENPEDVSAIKTLIESMATLADRNEFEALERIFADEVEVDYRSLAGGDVEVKSSTALMTAWAGLLPGFDRTRHNLSNMKINVQGNGATGSCDVTADHWADDLFWSVSGTYDFGFQKDNDEWRINKLTLNVRSERGTRDIFAAAMKHTSEYPVSYVIRQQTRRTVEEFYSSLRNKDRAGFRALWTDESVLDATCPRTGSLRRIIGKTNIVKLFESLASSMIGDDVRSNLVIFPMQDPEIVYVEYDGSMNTHTGDHGSRQRFSGIIHVMGASIALFRAHHDFLSFESEMAPSR